jgi:hypothetical protein
MIACAERKYVIPQVEEQQRVIDWCMVYDDDNWTVFKQLITSGVIPSTNGYADVPLNVSPSLFSDRYHVSTKVTTARPAANDHSILAWIIDHDQHNNGRGSELKLIYALSLTDHRLPIHVFTPICLYCIANNWLTALQTIIDGGNAPPLITMAHDSTPWPVINARMAHVVVALMIS